MSLPQPANYLGLWYTVQDSQATGAVPSNQIVLRKKAGDNTLYLETDAGEEEIVTSGGGGGATFSQVTITGNAVDTLLVQTDAKTEILRVDTNDEIVVVQGELQVQGNITLTGTLSTIMSNVLQFDDSLLKLSVGQTTTDAYDQGWYAEYSPNGVDVRYRGCIYDRTDGYFKFTNGMVTEPDGLAAITASGSLEVDDLKVATLTINELDCTAVKNTTGALSLQSFGADSGVQISADGKTIGINKVPTAGQALDINGGNVFINEGYLGVNRNWNDNNWIDIRNNNTGASSISSLYVIAGNSSGTIQQKSQNNTSGPGASSFTVDANTGRLHLQSRGTTTTGIIIANDGKTIGINKLPTAGRVLDMDGGNVFITRNSDTDHQLKILNTSSGTGAQSSIYIDANATNSSLCIYQRGVNATSGIGANNAEMNNIAGRLHLQSVFSTTAGIIIANDGKTIGINKLPTAGQALDINGGNVFINEGYLDIRRNVNGDNYMGVSNPNTGTSARSTIYVGAGTSLSRIGQLSNTYIGDVGAGNAYYRCDAGRLHLQSSSTTAGIIIANDGKTIGINKLPSAGKALDINGGAVQINEGPLNVFRSFNDNNYIDIINSTSGTSSRSSIYFGVGAERLRIEFYGPLNTAPIGANAGLFHNSSGRLHLQAFNQSTGIIIANDGKTIGINKLPTAGNALDINGGAVWINEGPLNVSRSIDGDNYIDMKNSNTGTQSRSSIYLIAGSASGRWYINSNNRTSGIGTNNMELVNSVGRLHLQSVFSTTAGIIIANDGKTVGINKLPTAGQALDIDGALTVSGYSTLNSNSGTYTPTFSNPGGVIDIASPTDIGFSWTRIGNIVSIAGIVSFTTNAALTAVSFEFTMPNGYTHTNTATSAQGCATAMGNGSFGGELLVGTANNRLLVRIRAAPSASIGTQNPFAVRLSGMFQAVAL